MDITDGNDVCVLGAPVLSSQLIQFAEHSIDIGHL